MPVRELFHLMHVVDDFDAADGFFTSLFSPEVTMPKSWSDFDKRWASIGLVGPNFALEIMEPSKQEADQGSPIPKFFRRFGEHLHSIALYVDADDLAGVIESLWANGVRVVRPDGSPFGDGELGDLPRTVFTHGRDTCGQLELQVFPGIHDPRFTDGWSGDYWRVEHPLGIERMSHVTVVVRDVDRAARPLRSRARCSRRARGVRRHRVAGVRLRRHRHDRGVRADPRCRLALGSRARRRTASCRAR